MLLMMPVTRRVRRWYFLSAIIKARFISYRAAG